MIEKDLKFLDFILPILSEIYPNHESISTLRNRYKKEMGVDIDFRELPIFVDNYNYEYFEQVSQMRAVRITLEWKEKIDIFGSVSHFIEKLNEKNEEENNKQKEIEEFQRINLILQNESLEYQKTLRDRNEKISKLELKLKRFEILQKWWWLIGIILIILGFVLSNLITP